MKKTFLFLATLLIFLSVGCKKESSFFPALTAEEALRRKMLGHRNADGGVTIASDFGYNRKGESHQFTAGFKAGHIYEQVKVGDVKLIPFKPIDGYSNQYVPDSNVTKQQLKNTFGKKINISLENQGAQPRSGTTASLDIPLEMTDLIIANGGSGAGSRSYVSRNVPLTWTADPNNDDVYILIMFEPESVFNANFRNSPRVDRFYRVNDNGAFTIPATGFDGIPDGAFVEIVVARGSTALIGGSTDGRNNTSIMAFTSATIVVSPASGGSGCNGDCIYVH